MHLTSEIAHGKTKVLIQAPDAVDEADMINGNAITAGDGARKDEFPRKGEYSTQTNDNVFRMLNASGVPTAYIRRTGTNTARVKIGRMLPYEVVGIWQITKASSARKRDPSLEVGARLSLGRYALFLKTTDYRFGPLTFPKNDPYVMSAGPEGLMVCRPDLPLGDGNPITHVPPDVIFGPDGTPHPFDEMQQLSQQVGVILQEGWRRLGCTLCDFKIELAFLRDGRLVVADVIDNDSWRLLDENGEHLDKQRYRDQDTPLEVVAELYREVAERSKALPIRW
jgi:phosphoribosylaminoimidazole-succinocarboxamide synthase